MHWSVREVSLYSKESCFKLVEVKPDKWNRTSHLALEASIVDADESALLFLGSTGDDFDISPTGASGHSVSYNYYWHLFCGLDGSGWVFVDPVKADMSSIFKKDLFPFVGDLQLFATHH